LQKNSPIHCRVGLSLINIVVACPFYEAYVIACAGGTSVIRQTCELIHITPSAAAAVALSLARLTFVTQGIRRGSLNTRDALSFNKDAVKFRHTRPFWMRQVASQRVAPDYLALSIHLGQHPLNAHVVNPRCSDPLQVITPSKPAQFSRTLLQAKGLALVQQFHGSLHSHYVALGFAKSPSLQACEHSLKASARPSRFTFPHPTRVAVQLRKISPPSPISYRHPYCPPSSCCR
jgi:hypothetical protein